MTATAGQIGYGTTLGWGDGASPENFTNFLEVNDISGLGFKRAKVDMTHLTSQNGYMESVPAMKDTQPLVVKCNMTPLNEAVVKAQADAGLTKNYRVNFPGTLLTYSFAGYVNGFGVPTVNAEGKIELTFEIQLTGAISAA